MSKKQRVSITTILAVVIGLGLSLGIDGAVTKHELRAQEHDHQHGEDDHSSEVKKGAASAAPHNEEEEGGHEKHEGESHDEEEHGDEHGQNHGGEHGDDHKEGEIELSAEQIKAAGITLGTARSGQINDLLSLPGEIRFNEDRTAHVVPRAVGVVEAVKVNLGEQVKKGQVLAIISSQQVSEQRSELAAAQQRAALARTLFSREKKLWEEQISAEQDYLQARQALQEAEINLKNAQQKTQALSGSSSLSGGSRYEVRAPFDGTVVEKHVVLGEVVNDTSNVFVLTDLSKVWATFNVSARDLGRVVVGKKVEVVAAELGSTAHGVIAYVGSLLGEQTRAATARVTLENPEGAWRPGLFVTINVATSTQKAAVTVPVQAIQTLEDKPCVFVRTPEGFQAQPVQLGVRDSGFVEVTKGLDAGTQIAVEGTFILKSELGKGSAEHSH
jgi:cobalt-zinc-cadmium efflux system membrane fusion protein